MSEEINVQIVLIYFLVGIVFGVTIYLLLPKQSDFDSGMVFFIVTMIWPILAILGGLYLIPCGIGFLLRALKNE